MNATTTITTAITKSFKHRFAAVVSSALVLVAAALFAITLPGTAHAWSWNWSFGNTIKGSGNFVTVERAVSNFNEIKVAISSDISVKQGSTEGVTIEADDNIANDIWVEVRGNALNIRPKDKDTSYKSSRKILITVNVKDLNKISVAGDTNTLIHALKTKSLNASVAGSGNLNIQQLTADGLKISLAGSAASKASGTVQTLALNVAGSGSIDAPNLQAQTAKLSIAGSGTATVWAKDKLSISVAGSGTVRYFGNPVLTQSVAGSASVNRLGDAPPN